MGDGKRMEAGRLCRDGNPDIVIRRTPVSRVLVLLVVAGCGVGPANDPAFFSAAVTTSGAAQLTYPADGAQDVDLTVPFSWTGVDGAGGYYLTIGTTAGARDLVDSGEISSTSLLVRQALPPATTLYVRLYTLVAGSWLPSDSTFTAAPAPIAQLANPTDGATSVDVTQPFRWSAVDGATAYYFTIGSQPGARDVINTGQLSATSYSVTRRLPVGVTLYARVYTLFNGTWRSSHDVGFTAAAPPIAQLTRPTMGSTGVDTTQPFAWTTVDGANSYYFTIGTTPGGRDVVDTGEIGSTSDLVRSTLPDDKMLYARVYTLYGGKWRNSDDVSFTAATAPIAHFTNPTAGATNLDLATPFQWTTVTGASAYYLTVGTTLGARDLVDTGQLSANSYTINRELPAGTTLYARVYTLYGGLWRSADATFTAAAAPTIALAHLDAPADGASGFDPSLPFRWTAVDGAQAYYLTVGTSVGARDLVDSGATTNTQYLTAATLPVGITLYARLYTYTSGRWRPVDSTFSAAAAAPVTLATLTYPSDGATNVDATQPFHWTAVDGASGYYLTVGSSIGGRDLVDSGQTLNTQYLVPTSLPAGVVVYARLYTLLNGTWRPVDSTFTATTPTPVPRAQLTYPADGTTTADPSVPFQWTSVDGASGYYLTVGTSVGARDLVDSGATTSTQYLTFATLPAGITLYARLYTNVKGVWLPSDSTFVAAAPPVAYFTNPLAKTAVDYTQPFAWTAVDGATAYYLTVGTTPGGRDIVDSGSLSTTRYIVSASFDAGTTYFARIYTLYGGRWRWSDVAFYGATAPIAAFRYPLDGASDVDLDSGAFEWNTVLGAAGYYLTVGTTRFGRDLLGTGGISVNRFAAQNLPAGATLHATLYTLYHDVWRASDVTFTTALSRAAELTYPADRMVNVDTTQPFQWTAVAGAASYALTVGTSPGGRELVDTGAISDASARIGTALPTSGTLYARVYTFAGGVTRYRDAAFRVAGAPITPAKMISPADEAANIDGSQPFRWSTFDLAQGYRLQIGTTFGNADVYDSGIIHVDRRLVRSLPVGVPLFGRISTEIFGQWYATDFRFTAATSGTSATSIRTVARWAIDAVRTMADDNGYPSAHTVLKDIVAGRLRAQATCLDYSDALREVLDEVDVTAPHRDVTVCLNANSYECHTLVEMQDPENSRWLVLDPTFDLAPRRTSDGAWATADELSAATQAMKWSDIAYDFLGAAGDAYARGYYIDYPLLYLNVYRPGEYQPATGSTPLPFLQTVAMPLTSASGTYVVQSASDAPATVAADGSTMSLVYNGIDHLSQAFTASTVAVTGGDPSSVTIYRIPRFVF